MNLIRFPTNQPVVESCKTEFAKKPRYSVDYALVEGSSKRYYIILDGELPARDVNKQLIIQQERRSRSVSSDAYLLCRFFNEIDSDGLCAQDVSLDYIEGFLMKIYVQEKKSSDIVRGYIRVISKYYEDMARRHMTLHPSLLRYQLNSIKVTGKDSKLTTIDSMKRCFPPKRDDLLSRSSKYTKWYSKEQIEAVSKALPPVDQCIFLDTLFTGHRIDSALSIQMEDFDPIAKTIYARQTKTGKTHVAPIPETLVKLIEKYIIDERSKIVERTGSTSNSLFLNKDGNPRTYSAYYSSMKRVEKRLKMECPDLKIKSLHTHAGRSTFLAALRSYQLDQRRKGLETFSDDDILTFMDWRSLSSLENYDLLTRSFETIPFQRKVFQALYCHLTEAKEYA